MYERIQSLKDDVYIIHILRLMKEIFHILTNYEAKIQFY